MNSKCKRCKQSKDAFRLFTLFTLGCSQPSRPPVRHVQTTPESVVDVVGAELSRVLEVYSLPLAHVAVLTSHRALRDTLIASKLPVKLARWDERDEDVVVCETVHRAKGLERLAIISVDLDEDRVHELDYIGSSRAVLHLTVITR